MQAVKVLNSLIKTYKSIREFARVIDEDAADITRWKSGKRLPHARAVVSIIKHHPTVKPHDLNPDVFEKGLTFNFNGDK